ncbi:MAG: sigma-54-dependent Fis family transcriptional regulator [Alistipes sp.]|nr:sigma-54-dependent Fis family transcriptional regulator [Alistipes sp.]
MTKVLILDASKSMRNTLRERLEYEGFSTETADSETVVRALCHRKSFDVLLTDRAVCLEDTAVPYIILSAEGSLDAAIAAVRDGAEEFLTKPIDMNRLLQSIHRAVAHGEESPAIPMVRPSTRKIRRAGAACGPTEAIIGSSAEIVRVRNLIAKVAPCEARVLITGENGTGKELVARHLHALSPRAAAPFVEVNCAAIPSELIESELFGHERGAFTSAIKQRKGKFELADGGTLFMDEIGDMSPAAQAKVLRALQERKVSRVGGDRDIDVNVRVIAATNKDLKEEIRKGNFREDLYHRIGVIVIRVPSLRERAVDIPELTAHFIGQLAAEYRMTPKEVTSAALAALQSRPWSGNIRELRNAVERLMILSGEQITEEDVETYC